MHFGNERGRKGLRIIIKELKRTELERLRREGVSERDSESSMSSSLCSFTLVTFGVEGVDAMAERRRADDAKRQEGLDSGASRRSQALLEAGQPRS